LFEWEGDAGSWRGKSKLGQYIAGLEDWDGPYLFWVERSSGERLIEAAADSEEGALLNCNIAMIKDVYSQDPEAFWNYFVPDCSPAELLVREANPTDAAIKYCFKWPCNAQPFSDREIEIIEDCIACHIIETQSQLPWNKHSEQHIEAKYGNYFAQVAEIEGGKWRFRVFGEQDCIQEGIEENKANALWAGEVNLLRHYGLELDILRCYSAKDMWQHMVGVPVKEFLQQFPGQIYQKTVREYVERINVLHNTNYTSEQLKLIEGKLNEHAKFSFMLPNDAKISAVSPSRADRIIENREPKGLFFCRVQEGKGKPFIGIDNTTGDAWTEEFSSAPECLRWLRSKEGLVDRVAAAEGRSLQNKFSGVRNER